MFQEAKRKHNEEVHREERVLSISKRDPVTGEANNDADNDGSDEADNASESGDDAFDDAFKDSRDRRVVRWRIAPKELLPGRG